ncbi:unnamed protein product [marine sediment metagenome]|uniref:Uncharacterized protein n=1 Tax=marine sediment metagenome TaxID=412755 RepID=X0S6W6_9ZZZZ
MENIIKRIEALERDRPPRQTLIVWKNEDGTYDIEGRRYTADQFTRWQTLNDADTTQIIILSFSKADRDTIRHIQPILNQYDGNMARMISEEREIVRPGARTIQQERAKYEDKYE